MLLLVYYDVDVLFLRTSARPAPAPALPRRAAAEHCAGAWRRQEHLIYMYTYMYTHTHVYIYIYIYT